MSTKRQDKKEDSNESQSTTEQQFQQEQQQAVTKVIDETRDNIKRTTNEARKEIPRYTQIVNDYQENTIQASILSTIVDSSFRTTIGITPDTSIIPK